MSTLKTKAPKVSRAQAEIIVKASVSPTDATGHLFQRKQQSLWQLYRDGVTSSFLNSFLTCLEQTRLSYVEGWSSRFTPMAFEFGTCVHWCLEQIYGSLNGTAGLYKLDVIRRKYECAQLVKAYEQMWLKSVPSPTDRQLAQQELCYGLAECILPGYLQRWDGDFAGGEYTIANQTTPIKAWVSLEEVFSFPYTYPDGKQVVLRGRRDGVFRDKRGKLWVFDTKCRSVINHEDALDTLPLDLQQMMYLYITYLEHKEFPEGTVMNILRRPGHRQGTDSLPVFLERVYQDVSKPVKYDHNYVRYQMSISKSEILAWKQNTFDPLMAAVRLWWEGTLPHYLNHNALITKYGRCSLFLPICKNDFSMCYRRKSAFNELAEI